MAEWEKYGAPTPRDQRISNVVGKLGAAMSEEFALAAVGVSGNESGFIWAVSPITGTDTYGNPPVLECDEPATVVGLEPANGDYAKMQLISNPKNAKAVWEAKERKLITDGTNAKGEPVYLATGAKAPNGRGQHDLFQLGLKYRDVGIISGFSIGPTQMFLRYSKVGGGSDASRGADWDDLYALYHTWDPAAFAARLVYMKKPPYPGRPLSRDRAIAWLARICQAGCATEAATSYYESRFRSFYETTLKATAMKAST
jgi:hypothetical protein